MRTDDVRLSVGSSEDGQRLWQHFSLTLGEHSGDKHAECLETWPDKAIELARAALDKLASSLKQGGAVQQELKEATLEEELRLWRWIHEEMHCSVPAIQTPSLKCWSVLDVDGEVIGEGASPVEAMREAEKRILQSPGHECI